jgi:DNA-binding response OmpR family regulator
MANSTRKQFAALFIMARILIVDDHKMLRHIMQRLLTSQGHEVCTVNDSVEARMEFRRFHPTLLITDDTLSTESGGGLIHELHDSQPDLKVLLMSAATVSLGHEALDCGGEAEATAVLQKPFHPRELLSQVARALAAQPAEVVGSGGNMPQARPS